MAKPPPPPKDPNATPQAENLRLVLRWTLLGGDFAIWTRGRPSSTLVTGKDQARYDARGRLIRVGKWDIRWRGMLPIDAAYDASVPLAGELVHLGFVYDVRNRLVAVDGTLRPEETKGVDHRVHVLYDRFGRIAEMRMDDAKHIDCPNNARVFVAYGPGDRLLREVRIVDTCEGVDAGALVYDYRYGPSGRLLRREVHTHPYGAYWDTDGYPTPASFRKRRSEMWRAEEFDLDVRGRVMSIKECWQDIAMASKACGDERTIRR